MRVLITAVDDRGRSCAAEQADLSFESTGSSIEIATVCSTTSSPPPPAPRGTAPRAELGLPPGLVRWMILAFEPGGTIPFHHTDTVDFGVVLDGSVELHLDEGDHRFGPGDCIVLNGVAHAWTAGAQGCRISAVSIGTPPDGDV
jgi:quercetin dioxygenase-like cupin family protein